MKRSILGLALLLLLPALVLAQAKPAAPAAAAQKLTLEFVNGSNLTVVAPDKSQLKFNVGIFEGDSLPAGSTLITGPDTSAELKLTPNGSIIKVGKGATFAVVGLAAQAADKNAFQVAAGKIKTVAAKGSNISVSTPTAVCGVRGTDFVVDVDKNTGKEMLAVKHGLVDFSKVDATGAVLAKIHVASGQAANALSQVFSAVAYSVQQYDQDNADIAFEKLAETEVAQPTDEEVAAEIEKAKQEDAAVSPVTGQTGTPGTTETTTTTGTGAAGTVAQGLGKMDKQDVQSGLITWLKDILGFELGSVSINGATYSKAIIQPNLNLGKLKMGLYLPVIYHQDLFDPKDWYHPAGNDELSFGMDKGWKDHPLEAALDASADIALKFKYVEFGRQLDDPFFFKVGNLDSLTIGHGLIMRNYNNGTEFPAVRRIGFNLGIDAKSFGFEALVNDLADPYLFGGRVFFRPIKDAGIALGLDAAVDVNPAAELKAAGKPTYGNPMFISGGTDLDLPIIKGGGLLTIRAFADAAVTIPYTREVVGTGATALQPGLQYQLFFDSKNLSFSNWGAAAGLMGNVLFLDWRLEYRYYTGFFKPSFYDSSYDKMRSGYVYTFYDYLTNPTSYAAAGSSPSVMGIYGEGGFSLIKDKLSFRFGYAWPWDPSAGADFAKQLELVRTSDELHAALIVRKGIIPFINAAGTITYDRRGLAQAIYASTPAGGGSTFQIIDPNTTFAGELIVPVPKTPNLDVAVVFASVPVRSDGTDGQEAGSVKYLSPGIPEMRPSITFETRFHF